jgi:HK97 family phage major capsid protein
MSKLAQLRERRDVKAREANDLNAKFPADTPMPKAEVDKLEALLNEIEEIDNAIKQQTRLAQVAGELAADVLDDMRNRHTREPGKQSAMSKAIRSYLSGGVQALSDDQRREMLARQTDEIRSAYGGLVRPQGAMSTTTPAEGGYTVEPEYDRNLESAMKAWGGMLEVASVFRTATGADMPFATADATGEVGEIVGQNTPATLGETTFGQVVLTVYKYSSKKLAIPWELLQDSFLDIEAYIQELLAMRLGRIQNTHFTVGTGTGQPRGIVPAATLGKTGTTGQTATVTYEDLVDLEHSINRAYRRSPGFGFMLNDSSLKVVRKVKDDQGRPIFVPGYEQGNPGGAPDRLLNRPITINDDVAAMAANAKSILCGDFRKYKIRRVMDLTIFRMTDSVFTLNGQVGFVAFQRTGGNLVDAGGAVKYYANSAT